MRPGNAPEFKHQIFVGCPSFCQPGYGAAVRCLQRHWGQTHHKQHRTGRGMFPFISPLVVNHSTQVDYLDKPLTKPPIPASLNKSHSRKSTGILKEMFLKAQTFKPVSPPWPLLCQRYHKINWKSKLLYCRVHICPLGFCSHSVKLYERFDIVWGLILC